MRIEEVLHTSEDSSWTGTKEAARWNGVSSEPLVELDINRTSGDSNGTEVAENGSTLSQERIQDEQSNKDEGISENEPADNEFHEVRSGRDGSEPIDAEISAADREAIEKAQQMSPARPRRSATKATYAPTCSPNGTEIAAKGESKKSKRESEPGSSSNSSKNKKRKTKMPASSLAESVAESEEKPKTRTKAAKKGNGSSQNQSIDLMDSEEEGEESVPPSKDKQAPKERKKNVIPDNEEEKEDEIIQTNNSNQSGDSQVISSENGHEEGQENEVGPKPDEEDKEKPMKSSKKNKKVESKEEKPASSNGTSIVTTEGPSQSTQEESTKVEKKESQTLMPNSGRSLSSILGTSHFNKGRSIGLTKKRSVPSLHLNRREPPKARKSMLIKLEHKKKKGQTNDCSDDEEANPFKRREGESEQAYMLRVCDEEGNHDVDNSKSRDRQDFDGNGKEAEEFIPDDDEDEHIDRGEEE